MVKARNMKSAAGNLVANQVVISDGDGAETFQSYGTTIAHRAANGAVTLDRAAWDYSTTTGKYRNSFLGETKSETEKKIARGVYVLADLNEKG